MTQYVKLDAVYRNTLRTRKWLTEVHIPDFQYVTGAFLPIVSEFDDELQVTMLIDQERWDEYLSDAQADNRSRIRAAAKENGFISATVWILAVVIYNDDSSPHGRNPENARGNPEFSGGSESRG